METITKNLASLLALLLKVPALPIVIGLVVPVALLVGAAKFSKSSTEALIFFGVLGVLSLMYSAWLLRQWIQYRESDD